MAQTWVPVYVPSGRFADIRLRLRADEGAASHFMKTVVLIHP